MTIRSQQEPSSPSGPPQLSPKFCTRFRAVCVECPNGAKKARRSGTPEEDPLPPFADLAIDALARCRRLTRRERDVLTLCCMGRKNSAMASTLGISISAVRRHLRNLHKKTATSDKAELILNLWHSCGLPGEPPTRSQNMGHISSRSSKPSPRG